eukprot:1158699-Pelagomonas_calceolata.AAC.11
MYMTASGNQELGGLSLFHFEYTRQPGATRSLRLLHMKVLPRKHMRSRSVARAAHVWHAPQVYIVAPRCDPFSGEAQMMASSCPQVLQGITVVHSLEEALADTQGEPAVPKNVLQERYDGQRSPEKKFIGAGLGRYASLALEGEQGIITNPECMASFNRLRIFTTKTSKCPAAGSETI